MEMRLRADTFLYGDVTFPLIERLLFYRMSSSLKAAAIYSRDVPLPLMGLVHKIFRTRRGSPWRSSISRSSVPREESERRRGGNTRRRVFWKNVTRDSNRAGEADDVTNAALVE